MSNGGSIQELGRSIDASLRTVLGHMDRCALVGFPLQGNVGDHAIWLGERAALRRLGVRVERAFPAPATAAEIDRGTPGDLPLLIHGGGNVGDTWPEAEKVWEDVVGSSPRRRIVILPQTVWFADRRALERARRIFGSHPDLTLMARDQRSLEFVRERLGLRTSLCPDLAFALGPIRVPGGVQRRGIVWLARGDREARAVPTPVDGISPSDWWDPLALPLLVRVRGSIAIRASRLVARNTWALPGTVVLRSFDEAARYRLARGVRLLSRGGAVITDRLHGHILCLLLGIPHVLLDNSYGKNRAFYETWTAGLAQVRWASDPDEALEIALEMANAAPHRI